MNTLINCYEVGTEQHYAASAGQGSSRLICLPVLIPPTAATSSAVHAPRRFSLASWPWFLRATTNRCPNG